jgi:hypothetical protein
MTISGLPPIYDKLYPQSNVQNNPVNITLANSPYTVPANISEVNVNTAGGNVRLNLPNSTRKITVNKTSSDSYLVTLYVAGTQIGEIAGELSSVIVESGQITKDEPWFFCDILLGIAGINGDGGEVIARNRFGKVPSSSWRGSSATDASSVIQAAIDSFPIGVSPNVNQNFHLHFGTGAYLLTDPIALEYTGEGDGSRLNILLSGNGRASPLVSSGISSGSGMLKIACPDALSTMRNWRLENLAFNCANSAGVIGLELLQANYFVIHQCHFYDFGTGAPISGSAGFATISDNIIYQCDGKAINGLGFDGVSIIGNIIGEDIIGDGIYLYRSTGCTVSGNVIYKYNTSNYAIYLVGDNGVLGSFNTVSGNHIRSYRGICIDSAKYNLIIGNTLKGTGILGTLYDGVVLSDASYCKISSNLFYGWANSIRAFGAPPAHMMITNNFMDSEIIDVPISTNIIRNNKGYSSDASGSSTGTGIEQTIAHGLAAIPTGCKAWIRYPISATVYAEKEIRMDTTNIYPKVKTGLVYDWRVE